MGIFDSVADVTKGARKGRRVPSAHEVAEHEGRVPQPGIPRGPRQTVAPTKGQQRKRSAEATQRSRRKAARSLRKTFHLLEEHEEPKTVLERAHFGHNPPLHLAKTNLPAYRKAHRIASEARHPEGLKEDPLAEFVIGTAATAGLGAGAKALGAAGKAGVEAVGAKLASKEASAGEQIAEKGIKATLKSAPRRTAKGIKARATSKVERVKKTPERVKSAPARAKKAASTSAGRRAAAKGGLRTARRHPVRTGVPVAAASPVPLPGELDKRANAFVKGTAAALTHPGKVLETTSHGALGFLTAPLAVAGSGVESIKQGSPAPLGHELKTLGEGTVQMAKNLASGNPKKVEETTLQETGLVPFIPVPHVLSRVKGSKAYEEARGGLRKTVEEKRASTRAKRNAEQKAAQEGGDFIPRKKAKKLKHSVADRHRPGEHYILRRTGKFTERQRSRHRMSREMTRMQEEGHLAGRKESEAIAKHLRKSKGTNQKAQNDADALRPFLNHGLPLGEKATPFIEMLHGNWPKVEHGDIPTGVHLERHSTKYLLDHPEFFKGKRGEANVKAIEEFDRQSKNVGTSRRNQFLAQVNNVINPILRKEGKHEILLPEQDITPEAKAILPKRDKPWSRTEALDYAKELRQVKGEGRAKALKQAQALTNGKGTGALDGLMKPPEHGGAEGGVSTTKAEAWTPQMERDFVKRVREVRAAHPLLKQLRDPSAYVADIVPSGLKGADTAPGISAAQSISPRKVWPSRGVASMSGNALSDFESLIRHSVESPRERAATVRGLNRVFDFASRQVNGRRVLTRKQVEQAINKNEVPPGTLFMRTAALKALLEGEHTLSPEEFRRTLMGEIEEGQHLNAAHEIAGDIEMMKAAGVKGDKFAPVDAVTVHELIGHLEGPGKASRGMGHATNFATRAILNSPAFEAAQFAQEGAPMAAALGKDVANIPKAISAIKEIDKMDAETQAQIRSVVGSSVGVLGAPSVGALHSKYFMDPIRAAGSKPVWRHAWELVNGDKIHRFDRARAGRMREAAAISRIEGDFKRAEKGFQLWRSGANNMFRGMDQAVKDMHGMNAAERAAYVTEHPQLADRLMQSMNHMVGNWNSFTVFEKEIQPFTIFYPFQRYSALWTLYHFPLDHPIVATALAALGQVNAKELQEKAALTGSTPNILDYTKPIFNETVLPAGQRFFPGLAAPQQAILEHKPTQAVGSLSPALAIPIEALTGKSAYTGESLGENGWLYAIRQFANLSPFMRFMGVPDIGSGKSAASEVFGAVDPLRTQRSVFDPYIGQTTEQFGKEKKLERKFNEKHGEGRIPGPFDSKLVQELLYGGPNGTPQPKLLPSVLRQIHAAEKASDFVSREEKPFLPPGKPFSAIQKKLLEEVENAWQTKPQKAKRVSGGIGGSGAAGIGGYSLSGDSIGGSVGGSIGGGIGGHPIGGRP